MRGARRAALLPLETWPAFVGQRHDAGGGRGSRGRASMSWSAVIGLRTVAGGGPVLRGRAFSYMMTQPRGLTHASGTCYEAAAKLLLVTWADEGGRHGPRGRRLQCRWATWQPVVGKRADAGGGHGPRGGQLRCCWWHGHLWLA